MTGRRAAAGLVAGLLASAACQRGVVIEEEPAALVCRHGADCDAKWARARSWVTAHSRWPIRDDTETTIATDAPADTTSPAFLIRRLARPAAPDEDAIVFAAACGERVQAFVDHVPARGPRWRNVSGPGAKMTECVPPVDELERDFARSVASPARR